MRTRGFRFLAIWLSGLALAVSLNAQSTVPVAYKAQTDARFLPLSEVRPGLKGTAYTVFNGSAPEAFGVEVLGVLNGYPEPRQSFIVIRLSGANATRTSVFAGMSGSPVYVDGRLMGAVAYSFPFSKEPIGGVTPIEQMLDNFAGEANSQQRGPRETGPISFTQLASTDWRGDWPDAQRNGGAFIMPTATGASLLPVAGQVVQPIATPLVYSGLSQATLSMFANELAAHNLQPVASVGGAAAMTPLAPHTTDTLRPGSSVTVQLVRGDYSFAASGTVTFRDGNRIYAFGHPFLNIGAAEMPMSESSVVTVIPSINNSFKLAVPGRMVGAITQDRASGIYGELGRAPKMIPVRINLQNSRGRTETFNYEIASDPALTPILLRITLAGSLTSSEREFGVSTFALNGQINVVGQPPVLLERRVSSGTSAQGLSGSVAATLAALMTTGFENVRLQGITLDVTASEKRTLATLERLEVDKTQVRRGEMMEVRAFARTISGEQFMQRIPLRVPTDAPLGEMLLGLGDGVAVQQKSAAQAFVPRDLTQLVSVLNRLRKNDRLYLKLLVEKPGAVIASNELPNLPPSMRATLGNDHNSGGYKEMKHSPIYEQEIPPAEFIITGEQAIGLEVVR